MGSKAYPDYTSDGKYRVIGTRPIRHDGVDKVTGRALYGADVRLPDMLYGKVLRSPHAHARILSIDCRRALEVEGVRAAATALPFSISLNPHPSRTITQTGLIRVTSLEMRQNRRRSGSVMRNNSLIGI